MSKTAMSEERLRQFRIAVEMSKKDGKALKTADNMEECLDEIDRLRAQTLEIPAPENIAAYVDVVRALGLFAAVHGLGTTGPTTETLPVIAWLERLAGSKQ